MLIEALFIIAKKWKQSKCPSSDEQINKIQFIHTMEYYSAIERTEVLINAKTQMNPGNIMPGEKSQ